jgi:hypothetical protein
VVKKPGALLVVAVAWVGVVLGHLTAYLLAYPVEGPRHDHLAVTGHSWLGLGKTSLLALIPVILLAVAIRATRPGGSWSGSELALRLAAVQVPAFALIEILERRGSVARTVTDPAVFIGLVLLPLVAVVAAWLLSLLHRAVRAVVVSLRLPRRLAPRSFPRPVLEDAPPRYRLLLPARRRAPPLPSSA